MSEWQPMDTAPEDREIIIQADHGAMYVVEWDTWERQTGNKLYEIGGWGIAGVLQQCFPVAWTECPDRYTGDAEPTIESKREIEMESCTP